MQMKYRDASGNTLLEGDYIAYSANVGDSAVLKFGVIHRLKTSSPRFKGDLHAHTPKLGVVTVERTYRMDDHDYPEGGRWVLQKKGQEITLGNLQNVLKVEPKQLPPEALTVLAAITRPRICE